MMVVVSGLPGSGKTYLARRIAEQTGAVHVSSDAVRNDMQLRGRYGLHDKMKVYHEMARQARQVLMTGRIAVVDATFQHHQWRTLFTELARELATTVRWILVQADEQVTKSRLSAKRIDSEADFDVYVKIRDQFEPIMLPHLTLTSTDQNIDEILAGALKYIHET